MEFICAHCHRLLDSEYRTIRPGSNDPAIYVERCRCMRDDIDDAEDKALIDVHDNMAGLFENMRKLLPKGSKETVLFELLRDSAKGNDMECAEWYLLKAEEFSKKE